MVSVVTAQVEARRPYHEPIDMQTMKPLHSSSSKARLALVFDMLSVRAASPRLRLKSPLLPPLNRLRSSMKTFTADPLSDRNASERTNG